MSYDNAITRTQICDIIKNMTYEGKRITPRTVGYAVRDYLGAPSWKAIAEARCEGHTLINAIHRTLEKTEAIQKT